MNIRLFALSVFLLLFVSCTAPEEQIKLEPPPTEKKKEIAPVEQVREFTFNERYYVRGASIGDPTEVDDPLQAIRVIQLTPGNNEVLVISSFDREGGTPRESWLGIELPSFAPGRYDLSEADNFMFYRFYLGEERRRIDGVSVNGRLIVESNEDGALTGSIDANISGLSRAFEEENRSERVRVNGSFRIQEVEFENTIMKTR